MPFLKIVFIFLSFIMLSQCASTPERLTDLHSFNCPVKGLKGYRNGNYKVAIAAQFDEALPFNEEGIARVRKGNHWYKIDKTGKIQS